MGSHLKQGQLLAKIFGLINESKVCPETTPREWVSLLLYLHHKGWLYSSLKGDEVMAVACGYRIPEVIPEFTDVLPREENGNILYVPFYANKDGSRFSALRFLKAYLKDNIANIKEVAFYHKGDEKKLKRYKVKGVKNE